MMVLLSVTFFDLIYTDTAFNIFSVLYLTKILITPLQKSNSVFMQYLLRDDFLKYLRYLFVFSLPLSCQS